MTVVCVLAQFDPHAQDNVFAGKYIFVYVTPEKLSSSGFLGKHGIALARSNYLRAQTQHTTSSLLARCNLTLRDLGYCTSLTLLILSSNRPLQDAARAREAAADGGG